MTDPRNRIQAATAAGAAALFVFVGAAVWGFWQRGEITDQICKAQIADREALRGVLVGSRELSLRARVRTEREERQLRGFYDQLLASVPELMCVDGKPAAERSP